MEPLVGAYVPRRTPLHRTPAFVKVLLLLGIGLTTVLTNDAAASLALLAAALAFLVSVSPPWRTTGRLLIWVSIVAALAGSYQWWVGDQERAIVIGANLMAIVVSALAVTVSTPMTAMLDLASRALSPLRHVVPHETIGLMFALTIRLIPHLAALVRDSRQAARARGLERSPSAILVPTVVRSVGFAVDLGQALQARGIGDDAARP